MPDRTDKIETEILRMRAIPLNSGPGSASLQLHTVSLNNGFAFITNRKLWSCPFFSAELLRQEINTVVSVVHFLILLVCCKTVLRGFDVYHTTL